MKLMRAMKLIVDGGKPRRATGRWGLWAILGLALACGFPVAAQEPDASAQTNDLTAAEILSQLNDLVQGNDPAQAEDMAPPNNPSPTSGPPQAGVASPGGDHPNRAQNNDRRSRGRRSPKSNQSGGSGSGRDYSSGSDRNQSSSGSGTNNGPVVLSYAAFQLIADRNIFDPSRIPHGPGAPRVRQAPKSIDSLTLVGTMSYEKGTFAFFDGTSSDYRKALKLTDSIAGYKVANITPNSVKLAAGTNELNLSVGGQLRREEDGPWRLSGQPTSYAATLGAGSTSAAASPTATGSSTTSGGTESDILKRLMQKREKE